MAEEEEVKRGDISNKLAPGIGIDVEVLIEVDEAAPWWSRLLGRRVFKLNDDTWKMVERLFRRDVRVNVYGAGYTDREQAQIEKVLESLPITRLVFEPTRVMIGQNHLDEVDVYFTVHEDFLFTFRLMGNVREFLQESDLYNWSRFFD